MHLSEEIRDSIQMLLKTPPDLVVIRDNFGTSLPIILADLSIRYPSAPFPVLVLSDATPLPSFPKLVRCVLPTTVPVPQFNDAVASLLKLPTRRSSRLPIRIGISLSQQSSTMIATTINISGTGMLIETLKPLVVGKVYEFRFMGVCLSTMVPTIPVRVLRRENPTARGSGTLLYVMEFEGVSVKNMEALIDSILPA